MKKTKVKTYQIPSFLLDAVELEAELEDIGQRLGTAKLKMDKIKRESQMHKKLHIAPCLFKLLIYKCYPKEYNSPLIENALKGLHEREFKNVEEVRDFIAAILFSIYFSEGEDKVFDLQNPDFYDDEKCQALFDQEIYIPENWLDQFINCLIMQDANEDMILHNLTPEWLWPRCFRLMMELYKMTDEAIKNNS
ncbi:MAG: hypothetical protein HY062_01755 [Bacteroidetes bacterium]|nr:hypothetical protein [Bacteroidota bacterium]